MIRPARSRNRSELARLVGGASYEVMPFKGTEDTVLEHVPTEVPITITVTEAKGIDATIDLATRLSRRGYNVNPHLPARQIRDRAELAEITARLQEASVERVFVLGGDAAEPAGEFTDALELLRAFGEMGKPFDIGITGYPEGHAKIADADLWAALEAKAPFASRIVTQMCFSADTILRWAQEVASRGVNVPIIVGVPGPVSRQKLIRISAGIGLGQSARFLQKQRGLLGKFFSPEGFSPNQLVGGLSDSLPSSKANIQGLRLFTFNDVAGAEAWRQKTLESLR
ncbi:methylenetetrahydrofolate reductase [Paenarthrobacter sp. TYUT067]|uniref:methylenetetrahydrofolate reductase n=1 Tax=Paenarthrobacter sp. TYUT067 TaxID=2926245 RepID=UPI00202F3B5A|nr:methylenetetrahydrofolate reductase [Paenarthrobacter sp. TYUT067]MCM0618559.1 methylenetetrahydrofolate reductase [Paenarthrobacter sp. TYUT067]